MYDRHHPKLHVFTPSNAAQIGSLLGFKTAPLVWVRKCRDPAPRQTCLVSMLWSHEFTADCEDGELQAVSLCLHSGAGARVCVGRLRVSVGFTLPRGARLGRRSGGV